jgi:hypothetical protein
MTKLAATGVGNHPTDAQVTKTQRKQTDRKLRREPTDRDANNRVNWTVVQRAVDPGAPMSGSRAPNNLLLVTLENRSNLFMRHASLA